MIRNSGLNIINYSIILATSFLYETNKFSYSQGLANSIGDSLLFKGIIILFSLASSNLLIAKKVEKNITYKSYGVYIVLFTILSSIIVYLRYQSIITVILWNSTILSTSCRYSFVSPRFFLKEKVRIKLIFTAVCLSILSLILIIDKFNNLGIIIMLISLLLSWFSFCYKLISFSDILNIKWIINIFNYINYNFKNIIFFSFAQQSLFFWQSNLSKYTLDPLIAITLSLGPTFFTILFNSILVDQNNNIFYLLKKIQSIIFKHLYKINIIIFIFTNFLFYQSNNIYVILFLLILILIYLKSALVYTYYNFYRKRGTKPYKLFLGSSIIYSLASIFLITLNDRSNLLFFSINIIILANSFNDYQCKLQYETKVQGDK